MWNKQIPSGMMIIKMTNNTKYWEITGPVQLEKNKKGKWSTSVYDWFIDNPISIKL